MMGTSQVGGVGLQLDEILVRFNGSNSWVKALLEGRLSLSTLTKFLATDPNESTWTDADRERVRNFWGPLAGRQLKDIAQRLERTRRTTFVNCWHRFDTRGSDLKRLANEYCRADFKVIVTTTVYRLHTALNCITTVPEEWFDLLRVIYVDDSDQMEEASEQQQLCCVPEINFKRRPWAYEREARVVIYDPTTQSSMWSPVPPEIPAVAYKYLPVQPESLITGLYFLDGTSCPDLESQALATPIAGLIHHCTMEELALRLSQSSPTSLSS